MLNVKLPNGCTLVAGGFEDSEYPCINIYLIDPEGNESQVSLVEYNPIEKAIFTGVYGSSDEDLDTIYYDEYKLQ